MNMYMLESQKKEEKTAYASLSETKANSEERKQDHQDYDHRLDGFAEFNILTDSECGFHFSIHYTFIRNPD